MCIKIISRKIIENPLAYYLEISTSVVKKG